MTESDTGPDFLLLPDLALRSFGGAVVWANDESFAEKENLIRPEKAGYRPSTFGHKGQVYDGWETRRRREDGVDQAIVRLGIPGAIYGIVVDTSWFKGNYPSQISVEALHVDGYPSAAELAERDDWTPIVARVKVYGDTRNAFDVTSTERWTHVRLTMYPDGGVARLRVHGIGVPDPDFLALGPIDLAALENGALVTACSNRFYSSPQNLLAPGMPQSMGDGWETARRRDKGNDWVEVRLAGRGLPRVIELDTTYFIANSPGAAVVHGRTADNEWIELLPRTPLQPDTRHRFPVLIDVPVDQLRLDIHPDGGMARLRVFGDLKPEDLAERWRR
ncbi:allantoicase [Smaragdicoccus niigatensis]|uniref:allantoicase n=1 Tax=Smaragdicoccus niigatensis TaxID=359359 RepID=UPI000367DCAB|nr:allantoicase [Smaragdicoccus niigatensis]